MSVVFGALDVAIFYLFSRKILNLPAAIISSLALTFLPLHISISTFGMTHPVSIFFHLLGLYFIFLYFDSHDINRLIFSSVFLGLGTCARLSDGITIIAAVFLYLTWSMRYPKLPKKDIVYRLMLYLILYSITILFFHLPTLLKERFFMFRQTVNVYYYHHSLEYFLFSSERLIQILGPEAVIIIVAGAGYFFLKKNRILFYFLATLSIMEA